jgi:hypothetical protein
MCWLGVVYLDPIGNWKVMHQVEEMDFSLEGILSRLWMIQLTKNRWSWSHGKQPLGTCTAQFSNS